MAQIQFDLFDELTDIEILKKEIEDLRIKNDNVRKGLFARHNELAKLYVELKEKYDILEAKLYHKSRVVPIS